MKQIDAASISFSSKQLVVGFEGGAVYSAEYAGIFYLVFDESAMASLLDAEDMEGLKLVKCLKFETVSERTEYIIERGWNTSSSGSGK